jgi:hypothetical protein
MHSRDKIPIVRSNYRKKNIHQQIEHKKDFVTLSEGEDML